MIEGKHVKKQVCAAVREVVRRARTEEDAREFVAEVHEALDEMLGALCEKRAVDWRNAAVADDELDTPPAKSDAPPKKKAKKKAAG